MASEYLKWKYKDVKPDPKKEYTKKELRANWWDYNLIWVIVGIVGALILFFIIKDMFFRTKPDYEVALIAANAPEEETQDALKARIAELGEDLNGDGKVAVELYIYDVDFSDPDEDYSDMERREAVMTRLTVDLTSGDVFLILVDQPEAFQARFGILSYLDGTAPDAEGDRYDASNWRDMVYRWEDCPVLKGMDLGTFTRFMDPTEMPIDGQTAMEGLYVGRRGIFFDKDKERFAGAERLWQALTAGAVRTEGEG